MEKNVAILATLLNKPKEEITKALETDGGLETIVSDFTTNNQMFNIDDLVSKIVTKTKPQNGNDDVVALKTRIVELENDYKDKLNAKQNEFDTSIIKSDFDKAIKALGLDYEGEVLTKQKGLLTAAFNDSYSKKRQDGKTIVLKGEDVIKDNKFDPLPLKDVLLGVAKEYGFQLKSPEPGGHGGTSSRKPAGLKGVTWQEYLDKNDVLPNTEAADKLFAEWTAANKE